MAPNQRPVAVFVPELTTLNRSIVKEPIVVLEETSSVSKHHDDYWTWSEPTDVLSTSHIVAKLIEAGKNLDMKRQISQLRPENDEYWAEERQTSQKTQGMVHSESYWFEVNHHLSKQDSYWSTPTTS